MAGVGGCNRSWIFIYSTLRRPILIFGRCGGGSNSWSHGDVIALLNLVALGAVVSASILFALHVLQCRAWSLVSSKQYSLIIIVFSTKCMLPRGSSLSDQLLGYSSHANVCARS